MLDLTREYRTRSGYDVADLRAYKASEGGQRLLGIIVYADHEQPSTWDANGRIHDGESGYDLIAKPKTGWYNVYKDDIFESPGLAVVFAGGGVKAASGIEFVYPVNWTWKDHEPKHIVETAGGRKVRVLGRLQGDDEFPIIAALSSRYSDIEILETFTDLGAVYDDGEFDEDDLRRLVTGYINIYEDRIFETEDQAKFDGHNSDKFIRTIKVDIA